VAAVAVMTSFHHWNPLSLFRRWFGLLRSGSFTFSNFRVVEGRKKNDSFEYER
jgi:hypothetical protein